MARFLPRLFTATTLALLCSVSCAPEWSGGIHARMAYSESRGLRVLEAPPPGPAREAGLREGDRIVAIDGVSIAGLAQADVLEKLRGRVGSKVKLDVERDDERLELVIERAPYRGD